MGRRKRGEASEGAAAGDDFSIHKIRQVCQILELLKAGDSQKAAAEKLGLDEATLSNSLGRLGNQLEITLHERRDGAKGQLVERSEDFLSAAQRLLKDYDALIHPKSFGSSRVLIGTYSAMIQLFLRHVFRELSRPPSPRKGKAEDCFVRRFPRTSVHALQNGYAATLLHDIARGAVDCGILDFAKSSDLLRYPGVLAIPLFPSRRKGFLYHRDNAAFSKAMAAPDNTLLDILEEQTLICARPEMDLLENGRALPPKAGIATRFFVENYFQVYVSVFEEIGVGIGFPEEPFDRRDVVKFVAFDDLPKEALDGSVLERLRGQERSTFYLCLPKTWERPRSRKGLSDAAKAVVQCILDTAKSAPGAWAA